LKVRLFYYLINGQLLCFYISARNFQISQTAFIQLSFFYVILHLCTVWYGLLGFLDPYILTVLIHGSLLTNAPLLILAFRFSLRDVWSHIVFFTINAGFSFIEFLFAAFAGDFTVTKWVARNNVMCPELQSVMSETFANRIFWTSGPIALGTCLAMSLSLVYLYDGWRNRGVPYTPYGWTFIRPRHFVWTKKEWQIQRVAVCSLASLIYIFSIIDLEYFIVHSFHSHASKFPDVSSSENGWSWGQMGAFLGELVMFLVALRMWLIDVCADSIKLLRTSGHSICPVLMIGDEAILTAVSARSLRWHRFLRWLRGVLTKRPVRPLRNRRRG